MEAAKLSRRSGKGKLTRAGKTVTKLLEMKRPVGEIYEAMKTLKDEYMELSQKHDTYCQLLTDDDLYNEEEQWMEVCWEERVNLEIAVNDYISSIATEEMPLFQVSQVEHKENQDVTNSVDSDKANGSQTNTSDKATTIEKYASGFKLRKEFLPTFDGDVREFGIFQADFKHIVESKCSDRDAITLLRSCLTGKPAELIRGIKNDYRAAWEYLESVYGDPRYVADAITNDLASFECLYEGEDERFCELVHLVRRSFNTLNEMGRSSDMDNNHVLALIEQKMCRSDRRNWSRDLVKDKKPATLKILMEWLNTEMIARMRSSAPLRNTIQSDDTDAQRVNYVAGLSVGRISNSTVHSPHSPSPHVTVTLPDKCWLCHTSDHWTDQCPTMNAMTPTERLQKVKENHGCFSCLKRAGRNHTAKTCYRRRQCPVMNGGEQCMLCHHQLLHDDADNQNTAAIRSEVANRKEADNRNRFSNRNKAANQNETENPYDSAYLCEAANLNGSFTVTTARAVNTCRVRNVTLFNPSDISEDDGAGPMPHHVAGIDEHHSQPIKSPENQRIQVKYAAISPANTHKKEKLQSIHAKMLLCPPKDPHGPLNGHDVNHASLSMHTKMSKPEVGPSVRYRKEMPTSTKHANRIIDIHDMKDCRGDQDKCAQDEVPREQESTTNIHHNQLSDTEDRMEVKGNHHTTNYVNKVVAFADSPADRFYPKTVDKRENVNPQPYWKMTCMNSTKLRNSIGLHANSEIENLKFSEKKNHTEPNNRRLSIHDDISDKPRTDRDKNHRFRLVSEKSDRKSRDYDTCNVILPPKSKFIRYVVR